jgi:hypothetical protein
MEGHTQERDQQRSAAMRNADMLAVASNNTPGWRPSGYPGGVSSGMANIADQGDAYHRYDNIKRRLIDATGPLNLEILASVFERLENADMHDLNHVPLPQVVQEAYDDGMRLFADTRELWRDYEDALTALLVVAQRA